VDKEKLVAGTRVALDMTTLTIMRALPREVISCVSDCPFSSFIHCTPLEAISECLVSQTSRLLVHFCSVDPIWSDPFLLFVVFRLTQLCTICFMRTLGM
jgi:hypothetical protein